MRALVLTALTIALALPSSASPTPPGSNGLIAFVSHTYSSGVGNGIAVIRPDGSGLRKLTRDARDRSPAWSPDGRSIAFTRRGALFLMRADGSLQRALFRAGGPVVDRPSWSPDGRWLAFGLTEDGPGGSIMVISRSGGEPRYLTDGRVEPDENTDPAGWPDDRGPDWSPDGARIAFTRVVWLGPRCDQDEVFSVDVDGSDVRWVTMNTGYASSKPSWSPDGNWFAAETSDGLAILTASGTLVRVVDRAGTDAVWQRLPKG